jgi:hypothetical protein
LSNLYQNGKQWVTDYKTAHGFLPPLADYQAWAVKQLSVNPACLISTAINDTAMGSVSSSKVYEPGVQVTVTATPKIGYKFLNWNDGSTNVSTSATFSFTSTTDVNLTAYFGNISTVLNPTNNVVKLKYNPINSGILFLDGEDIKQVILYNAMGQQLFNGKYEKGIDISYYPVGVYVGKVLSGNNQISIIRFIKK